MFGHRFSRSRLEARWDAVIESRGRAAVRPGWLQDEILHPYLGFVPLSVVRDGRFAVRYVVPGPTDDRAVIAVVGGSFAHQFAEEGLNYLIERLRELPEFTMKTFTVLNAAVGGGKQPQQLMAVAQFLALGERIDILINLDGFNEIVLHPTENAPAKVSPVYPRRWHQRVEGVLSRDGFRLMLRRTELEERRIDLARAMSRPPWPSLSTTGLIYLVMDESIEGSLMNADRDLLNAERQASAPVVATGPPVAFATDLEMFRYLADLWQRSSRAIHELATGSGIRYYHFLQPNQYVPGSKTMQPEETRDALRSASPIRRIVETAYPLLREAGRSLTARGVRFQDLTAVFMAHSEPLYIDACCHVSRGGNVIVADRVFEVIRRDIVSSKGTGGDAAAVKP